MSDFIIRCSEKKVIQNNTQVLKHINFDIEY